MLSFGLPACAQGRSMPRPYRRALCFTESHSAEPFPAAICPSGRSLPGPEQKVQHTSPRLNRETFGFPRVFTPLCLCNPHLQSRCVDIYLFVFPLPGMGGSAKPTCLSSPGHGHCPPSLLQVTSSPSCESSVTVSAEFR